MSRSSLFANYFCRFVYLIRIGGLVLQVTAEDAHDVVQLLQESLLDVFTTETGAIDCSRKGGISLSKQVHMLQQHTFCFCAVTQLIPCSA